MLQTQRPKAELGGPLCCGLPSACTHPAPECPGLQEEGGAVSGAAPACKAFGWDRLLAPESGFVGPGVAVRELLLSCAWVVNEQPSR